VQIRNSNSHVLKACLKKWSIVPDSCKHVHDLVDEIEFAIAGSLSSDMIIICGGVSAGDADYVPGVLHKLGAERIFHKVAIKPGKPIWFGKIHDGPIVFALPGNPLSCLVTFKLFIEYFLTHCFGLGEPFQLAFPLKGTRLKKNALDEFFPVNITGVPSFYDPVPFNGSGDITAALHARAIARHPATIAELSNGAIVHGYPLV
jgi:molybdopterin molybdotransferase